MDRQGEEQGWRVGLGGIDRGPVDENVGNELVSALPEGDTNVSCILLASNPGI